MRTFSSSSFPAGTDVASDATDVLDLSVIIVNYNVREFLEQALRSVEKASAGLDVEVFVVDNNSVDGSADMVRAHFPNVQVIANENNVGFSVANNQAIRQASGRYLLILNPDTILQEDTLSTLVRFMEAHPEAGAVGCQILNPDGTFALESRRSFPTPRVAFFRMIGLSRFFPHSRRFGQYNLTYLPIDEVAEVDALSGSCMMVRHAALYYAQDAWKGAWERERERARRNGSKGDKSTCPPSLLRRLSLPSAPPFPDPQNGAGLFDEGFFMYGEDLDWCYRIQQAGWKIFYTPETQIIHYKGESTKKGELRYVKLFYGAMLRFAEKHLQHRSRLFLWILHLGVWVRAGLTVAANALRRAAPLLLDLVLVAATVGGLGLLRTVQTDFTFPPLFYGMVVPGYALITVAAVALCGGYRRSRLTRIGPVWLGTGLALLVIAAVSFFVKDIGFSRAVVLTSFPVGAALLSALRLVRRSRRNGPRTALFVGYAAEARRLQRMLSGHPHPPFQLIGYVAPDRQALSEETPDLPGLGTLRHLRDLVRLRRIDDVVFAADGLSNQTIFRLMRHLRDLPVQLRILAEGREHVIGKAEIDDLSTPSLIEAEAALGAPRSYVARRAFEVAVALLGLGLYPFIVGIARFAGAGSFWTRLSGRTRQASAVLTGRCRLVGYHDDEAFRPPPEWDLQPGVFAVTEALSADGANDEAISQTYWLYARNQSAFLDCTILLRAIRNMQ